jgi:hypothetical protein
MIAEMMSCLRDIVYLGGGRLVCLNNTNPF